MHSHFRRVACIALALASLFSWLACGGSGNKGLVVTISPSTISLSSGGSETFTATVTGSSNTALTWTVTEANGGTVTPGGVYTAPEATGTFHVVATSVADTTKSATATLTVTLVTVALTPSTVTLPALGTATFIPTVGGTTAVGVNWSVKESGGGTVDSSGHYTAPATPGTYHVIATSITDSTQSGSATVSVVTGRFVYVPSFTDATVSVYAVDAAHGWLRPMGYVATSTSTDLALHAALDGTGKFLLVANGPSNTVGVFAVNPVNGQLTAVSGSPFATGGGSDAAKIAFHPSNQFVYVTSLNGVVSAFGFNSTTGALTAVGSPVATGASPWLMAIHPNGQYLYVLNQGPSTISAYSINATTGALTALGSPQAIGGTGSYDIKIDPTGQFLYTANVTSNNVSAFSINATTGALTALGFSPISTGAGSEPASIAFDPYGKYMLVSNDGAVAAVNVYSFNSTTGALTAVAGSPFATNGPTGYVVNFDPSGQLVYVGNLASAISVLSFDKTSGALSFLQTVAANGRTEGFAITQGVAPVSVTPSYAYVANHDSGNVSAFTVNSSSGALTSISGSPFAAATHPKSIALDPHGRFAFVVTEDAGGNVLPYTIENTGGLSAGTAADASNVSGTPRSGTVDPSGRFLLVSDWIVDSIYVYSINQSSGVLTAVSGSPFASGFTSFSSDSTSVVVDPTGRFVYVCEFDNHVSGFTINRFTGALTAMSGSPYTVGTNAASLAVDPTGKFLFVVDAGGNQVFRYAINPGTGVPGASASVAVGTAPKFVAPDPFGRFVYVTNYTSGSVSAFTFNAFSGALNAITGSPFSAGTNAYSATVDPSGSFLFVENAGASDVMEFAVASNGALTAASGSPITVGTAPRSVVMVPAVQ